MKSTTFTLAFLPLTTAVVLPRQSTCYFSLAARGSPNGTVLESPLGENLIGGNYPPTNYTISNHALSTGRGQSCVVDATTNKFECVASTTSTTNFTLADNGALLHDDCPNYYACPVDEGSWEVYGDALTNSTGCALVTLIAGGFSCAALGSPASSSAAVSSSTPTTTATSAAVATSTGITCPTALANATTYLSSSFIIPISSASPNTTFPPSSGDVLITPDNSTILNFAIPDAAPYASTLSNMCALIFDFPTASALANKSATYSFSGVEEEKGQNGGIDFTLLSEIADANTTWTSINSTQTSVLYDFGTVQIIPGGSYEVARFECAGEREFSVQLSSVGGVQLEYIQDSRVSAIGAFVVPCV
ncbi:hypothetical protein BP5796_01812 [Coleophoma crateriformis]|uniref:Ubiquitin 3 binding protein But2 C-terminal domain-containing protein n=1 Tax=Coleophoma crateriformis TaxID=565419 RepID=A0A3D8T344_9HELO|nr:hypothetical protein BP5796_01812 [Coleophoma crateriformis]